MMLMMTAISMTIYMSCSHSHTHTQYTLHTITLTPTQIFVTHHYAEVRRFIFTVMHISICFIYMMIIFGNSTYFHISLCMHLFCSMPVFIIVDVLVCICVCTTIHNDVYAHKLLFFVWCSCTLLYMYSYVHSFLPFTINRLYCLYIVYIIIFVQW